MNNVTFQSINNLRNSKTPAIENSIIWTENYVAKPHPLIGRTGPVCPKVPIALREDSIFVGLYPKELISEQEEQDLIPFLLKEFFRLNPTEMPKAVGKALLLVLPNNTEEARQCVERVQRNWKEHCLKDCILIGKFHATLPTRGLHNQSFTPSQSPYPMLALRYAVETDVRFMLTTGAPNELKARWIKTYLKVMRSSLGEKDYNKLLQELQNLEGI